MKEYKKNYKEAALVIANKICRDAIWNGDTCNWVGLTSETDATDRIVYSRALPPDFYDGVAGVVYFLLQVYRLQPNPVLFKTINGALQQIMAFKGDKENLFPGFYQGKAGIVFVLKEAAKILDNPAIAESAEKKMKQLISLPVDDEQFDIISGYAGVILFLLFLYRQEETKQKELLNRSIELGNFIIQKANKTTFGYSWKTLDTGNRNLTGYAHGASGIASALNELYAITQLEIFLHAGNEAFRYEDSFFNEQQQNWPDFRFENKDNDKGREICSLAWCHGAPGIGLARLRAFEITQDEKCKAAALKAIGVTKNYFNAENVRDYSLCHGLFGNAILLLKAASVFHSAELEEIAYKQADKCLEQFIDQDIPVPNGYESAMESPCFMQGNSGIGYFFLHLYNPDIFPQLLESAMNIQQDSVTK
jgi:type 2 lantibiotic biosynthesis protein LanM